jgi:MFS family permease
LEEKLWTKNFCLLSLSSFFVYIVFYSIIVVIALYSLQQLHATGGQAGLAAGDFLLAALISRIFTGHYIEWFGKNRMMRLGLVLYSVVMILYFLNTDIYALIGIRFLHGMAFGICATALSTLVASSLPKRHQSEGMGYFLLSITLASALGPCIGIYVYQQYGFEMILLLCLMMCLFSLCAVLPLHISDMKNTDTPVKPPKGLQGYFEITALPISLIGFVIYLCYSGIISFFSTYANEIHMMDAGQYFFLVYSLAIIVSRPLVGRLADRGGCNCVMYPSFVLFAAGFVILSKTDTPFLMFAAAILLGIGFGTFAAISQVIAIQKTKQDRIGIALSTLLAISELGTGMGPFLLGGLLAHISFQTLYIILGVVTILTLGVYVICCHRHWI